MGIYDDNWTLLPTKRNVNAVNADSAFLVDFVVADLQGMSAALILVESSRALQGYISAGEQRCMKNYQVIWCITPLYPLAELSE